MRIPNDPQLDMCKDRPCINCHGTMTNDQGNKSDDGITYEYGFSCNKCTTTMNISVDERGGDVGNASSPNEEDIICERQKPWLKQLYRMVDGHYMPNIICLDEVTNRILERYCEPRGSSDEASHEYTYNGTTIRWVKREHQ